MELLFFTALFLGLLYSYTVVTRQQERYRLGCGRGKSERAGYVYFYRGRWEPFWHIKIGKAKDPIERLKSQRTANPHGLVVYGVVRVKHRDRSETYIHHRFAGLRLTKNVKKKNEWFYFTPKLWFYVFRVRDKDLTNSVQKAIG